MTESKKTARMKADVKLIKWLIFQSGESLYSIGQKTTVSPSTLSKIKNGDRKIEKLTWINASLLADYAKTLKKERGI